MKATTRRHYYNNCRHCRPYPNAADQNYFKEKLLDGITSVVTGMGIVTILIFLITM